MTTLPPEDFGMNRRGLLQRAGTSAFALGALAAGGSMFAGTRNAAADTATTAVTDADILNFALNLEYLETEYYLRAVTGRGIPAKDTTGVGGAPGKVTGGRKVQFRSTAIQQIAEEIAEDELGHVLFIRSILGSSAVSQPDIDIEHSFNMIFQAAGLGERFDPYASEVNFLVGGFIFEDVGVTAYHGAAPLFQNREILSAATGILAIEAYHASELRLLLLQAGQAEVTDRISAVRASLSGAADDQGVTLDGKVNIVPTDENGLAFARSTRQVQNIAFGAVNANQGLFFPKGMRA
ncbi:MAG TPA: ferritin-like domain-containing protein [Aliidongia sp.]|nr:ferritin-like domain-containing protein [Aliidongia sp.]